MIEQGSDVNKYGKLRFVRECGRSSDKHILWVMVCDCGGQRIVAATRARNGNIYQCVSCSRKEHGKFKTTHGMRKSSTYCTWQSIKDRCLRTTSKDYARYGGKGITMCKEWADSFECFLSDMGEKPKGCSIDRIDNTKGYSKENCRWATSSEQQRNKRNSRTWLIKGMVFETLSEAANHFGVTEITVRRWVVGAFDARRNTFTEPRDDCKQFYKY